MRVSRSGATLHELQVAAALCNQTIAMTSRTRGLICSINRRGVVSAALAVAVCSAAIAGNPFKGMTTTESGYHTWDSDLINLETVPQTGNGVYVAVLDTGMVPNWRDYFPEARVATHLGTGFDQPVSFRASKSDPCGLDVEVGNCRSRPGWARRARRMARMWRAPSSVTSTTPISTRWGASRCRRSSCEGLRRT